MNDNLKNQIDRLMNERNNLGIPEFEGYSPNEMEYILYDIFGENSPVHLLKMTEPDYKKVPLLNQIKYLAGLIDSQGELKMTSKGFLPVKVVADIYQQGFLKDEFIEVGISKLYKEADSLTVNLTRILLEISGLANRRKNKLSLTKKGKTIVADDYELLLLIFKTFGTKFNWAYYDGYGQINIGQMGFGFSMVFLSKYGNKRRKDRFYADKYFEAFPQLINATNIPRYGTVQDEAARCYSIRTFDRFLDFFGLIEIEQRIWNEPKIIRKTTLFDRMIKCTPHGKGV